MTSQYDFEKNMVLVDYKGILFYMWQNFWPHAVYTARSGHLEKSLYNQPKPYFFQNHIGKSFLDRF
jgi:hypothetical protein